MVETVVEVEIKVEDVPTYFLVTSYFSLSFLLLLLFF